MKKIFLIFLLALIPSIVAIAQDDNYVKEAKSGVVRISIIKIKLSIHGLIEQEFGTGFCVDRTRVFTNFHISEVLGKDLVIEGKYKVKDIWSPARLNGGGSHKIIDQTGKFEVNIPPDTDWSILTLEKPLPESYKAFSFAIYQPTIGQDIIMIARHNYSYDIKKGKIIALELDAKFKKDTAFSHYSQIVADVKIRGGNSGGVIIDKNGQVLGILYSGGDAFMTQEGQEVPNTKQVIATALPVKNIFNTLRTLNKELFYQIFFGREVTDSEVEVSLQKLDNNDLDQQQPVSPYLDKSTHLLGISLDNPPVLSSKVDEAAMVKAVRDKKAENLTRMHNVYSEQRTETWGDNATQENSRYIVIFYYEKQVFKKIKADGTTGKEIYELPVPKPGISPSTEWYSLMDSLDTLPLTYKGESSYKNRPVLVFYYEGSAKDRICFWSERTYGLFGGHSDVTDSVPCRGRIITDEKFNVLDISQNLYPQQEKFAFAKIEKVHVSYDFKDPKDFQKNKIQKDKEQKKDDLLLLPLTIDIVVQVKHGNWYFLTGDWHNYHLFSGEQPTITSVDVDITGVGDPKKPPISPNN